VLPRRVPGYHRPQLDALCATGEVVWVAPGSIGSLVYFREDAPLLGAPAAGVEVESEAAAAILAALSARRCSGKTFSPRPELAEGVAASAVGARCGLAR